MQRKIVQFYFSMKLEINWDPNNIHEMLRTFETISATCPKIKLTISTLSLLHDNFTFHFSSVYLNWSQSKKKKFNYIFYGIGQNNLNRTDWKRIHSNNRHLTQTQIIHLITYSLVKSLRLAEKIFSLKKKKDRNI